MIGPRPFTIGHDGRDLAGLDWGGAGEHLALLHPNGFCAGLFDPLARRLASEFRALALDLAGHGRTSPLGGAALMFRRLAADAVAVLDALGVEAALAVGQSLGGGVAVLVDEARPGLFGRLRPCEAVAFPATGGGPNPMSERARTRRAVWADRDEFVPTIGNKPPLPAAGGRRPGGEVASGPPVPRITRRRASSVPSG